MPEENRRIVQSPDDSASPIGQLSRRKTDCTVESSEPHEQEISIDDYMARLLNRARGATPDVYRPADTALHSSRDRPALRTEPVKMEPRAKAPEASIGLAVMREIANQTARAAITTHHRHRLELNDRVDKVSNQFERNVRRATGKGITGSGVARRAMAMKFQLPDGKNADILALSTEGFPERTHEGFRNLKLSRDSVPKEGVWWSRKNLNPRRQAEPRSRFTTTLSWPSRARSRVVFQAPSSNWSGYRGNRNLQARLFARDRRWSSVASGKSAASARAMYHAS